MQFSLAKFVASLLLLLPHPMKYDVHGFWSEIETRCFLITHMPYYIHLGERRMLLWINLVSTENLLKHLSFLRVHIADGLAVEHIENNVVCPIYRNPKAFAWRLQQSSLNLQEADIVSYRYNFLVSPQYVSITFLSKVTSWAFMFHRIWGKDTKMYWNNQINRIWLSIVNG